jgi:hypothetical protein
MKSSYTRTYEILLLNCKEPKQNLLYSRTEYITAKVELKMDIRENLTENKCRHTSTKVMTVTAAYEPLSVPQITT